MLPADVRARAFHELEQLEYGCEMLFLGFTYRTASDDSVVITPHIIEIDRYGEVTSHQNFGAVGTGSVIAKSTLYQREQSAFRPIEATLYHLYEAAKLAAGTAPGVGEIQQFFMLDPPTEKGREVEVLSFTDTSLQAMKVVFEEVGQKPLAEIPLAQADWIKPVVTVDKKDEGQSDAQTSEDRQSPYSEESQETDQTSSDD